MNRYINAILMMSIMTLLVGTAVGQDISIGKTIFDTKCGSCHNTGAMGAPNATALSGVSSDIIRQTVRQGAGSGRMPAFNDSDLTDTDLANVIGYLGSLSSTTTSATTNITATPSESNESYGNATSGATSGMTTVSTPEQTVSLPIETPAGTIAETPTGPVAPKTPKSPGFDIILAIVGILLIYRLKSR